MKNKKNTLILVVPSSINQIPDHDIVRLQAEDTSLTLIRNETESDQSWFHVKICSEKKALLL